MSWLWILLLMSPADSPFAFREVAPGALELSERGRPVYVYNYGMMLKEGAPEDRRRACYLHPLWTPGGTVVTDDFPRDHYHHRGVFWAWPRVRVRDQMLDLWSVRGIQQKFLRWTRRETGPSAARLEVENGWFLGDRILMRERVRIATRPAHGPARELEFQLRFEALEPLEIAGEPAQSKGYGGFSIRFAPRRQTVIRTEAGIEKEDSNMVPHPWAELEGDFGGRRAAVRIEIAPSNPGYPNGWCIRHYGFLGVNFPGLEALRLEPGQAFELGYRVVVSDR